MKQKAFFTMMLATGISTAALMATLSAPANAATLHIHLGFPVIVANDNQQSSWGDGDRQRYDNQRYDRHDRERAEHERDMREQERAREYRQDEQGQERSHGCHEGWGHRW